MLRDNSLAVDLNFFTGCQTHYIIYNYATYNLQCDYFHLLHNNNNSHKDRIVILQSFKIVYQLGEGRAASFGKFDILLPKATAPVQEDTSSQALR